MSEAEEAGDTELAEELQAQRTTVMNASFLRASLFTSVLSYGVAAMAVVIGFLFVLGGLGLRQVAAAVHATAPRSARESETD